MKNKIELKNITIFYKKTDPKILNNYFHFQNLMKDVSFDKIKIESKSNTIYLEKTKSLVSELDDKNKAKILLDFNKARFFIKNTDSFSYLISYIQTKQIDLSIMDSMDSMYDKIVYILTHHRKEFEDSYILCSSKNSSKKYWTMRKDYYDYNINRDTIINSFGKLKDEVQLLFKNEFRGNKCLVEEIFFESEMILTFYLENYPEVFRTLGQQEIEEIDIKTIIDAMFVIDFSKKTITTHTNSKDKQKKLHQIFAKIVFDKDVSLHPRDRELFDPNLILQKLIKNKSFLPEISPLSWISDVYVNQITLINKKFYYGEIILNIGLNKKNLYNENIIYGLLQEQKGINDLKKYDVKSVKFTVNFHSEHDLPTKNFTIDKNGNTNLDFEESDRQIKNSLREWGFMKDMKKEGIKQLTHNFLSDLFVKIDSSLSKEVFLNPQEVREIDTTKLNILESHGLIKKYAHPKGWCNNCDKICDITNNGNDLFSTCSCSNEFSKVDQYNVVEYYCRWDYVASFLCKALGLSNEIEAIVEDRLIYLGDKNKFKFYLFIKVNEDDSIEILNNKIDGINTSYVFCLRKPNSKVINKIELFNLIDKIKIKNKKLSLIDVIPKLGSSEHTSKLASIRNDRIYGKTNAWIKDQMEKYKEPLLKGEKQKKQVDWNIQALLKREAEKDPSLHKYTYESLGKKTREIIKEWR